MFRGLIDTMFRPAARARAAAPGERDDDKARRTMDMQVKGVVLATFLLAGIFLSATAHAVFTIDAASIELDKERATTAVRLVLADRPVLDDATVRWVADNFHLSGARLTTPDAVSPGQAMVPAGDLVLAWTPRRLGTETFRSVAPLRIAIAVATLLAIALVMYRLHALARHIDARRIAARNLATIDALTGLGNRLHFDSELRARIDAAAAGRQDAALLLLDLDGFKAINDRLGHVAGDRLLQEIAHRLRAYAGAADAVARLGGDEFAIIRNADLGRDELDSFAEGLLRLIASPCTIDGENLVVSASVGIARIDGRTREAETFLRLADAALYRAKARRGGSYEMAQAPRQHAILAGSVAA